jgi:DNA mismatch endonuclease, patch repair protein
VPKGGYIRTAKHRAKMSAILTVVMGRPEVRAKIAASSRGKRLSAESREKVGAANRGKCVSVETRAKQSAAQTKRFTSTKMSAKTRAKLSIAHKGKRLSVEHRVKIAIAHRGKHLSAEHRAKIKAARALRIIPLQDTKPELAVQEWLVIRKIEFVKHKTIPGLCHQWDIQIKSKKVLIEVDGCYWHACPIHHPASAKGLLARQRAAEVDAYAVLMGWRVIRIWEHEINAGEFSKLELILNKCRRVMKVKPTKKRTHIGEP